MVKIWSEIIKPEKFAKTKLSDLFIFEF